MYTGLHVKYPSYLSEFNETWIRSTDFLKILKYQTLMEAALFIKQTDGRTEGQMNGRRDEPNIRFSQFYERILKTVILHSR
jgi:hypothetical protein